MNVQPNVCLLLANDCRGMDFGSTADEEDTLSQVKNAVAQVLAKDNMGDRRPISLDIDDFVKLLHDFNKAGIHFS